MLTDSPRCMMSRLGWIARRAAEAWVAWPNKKVVYHSKGHGGALGWNVVREHGMGSGCLKRVCVCMLGGRGVAKLGLQRTLVARTAED